MNCETARRLLDAYLDGELALDRSLEIEQHLRECAECSAIYRNRQTVRDALSDERLYFRSAPDLRQRTQRALRASGTQPRFSLVALPRWNLPVAALVVLAFAVGFLLRTAISPSVQDQLAEQIVASHVRSLMLSHLTDVASTDQHTVKPWFDGKLDFSPPVVDLASAEFPLIGGRLDYADNRPIAALVYQRRKHIINLFIWPSRDDDAQTIQSVERQGYQIVHWTQGGMTYWGVSDVSSSDLMEFRQLLQTAIAATKP